MLMNLQPLGYYCLNFRPSPEMEIKVTVMIVPICITESEGKNLISWSCNRGQACHNIECRYAFKEHENK
jgi:hypothetical protein